MRGTSSARLAQTSSSEYRRQELLLAGGGRVSSVLATSISQRIPLGPSGSRYLGL